MKIIVSGFGPARGRLQKSIARLSKASLVSVHKALAEVMISHALGCFDKQADPWGRAWRPNSQTTLALMQSTTAGFRSRRRNKRTGRYMHGYNYAFGRAHSRAVRRSARRAATHGHWSTFGSKKLLVVSGFLRQSLRRSGTAAGASIGTSAVYGGVHQFGNPRNRLPNRPGGSRAPIPARPFLPMLANGQLRLPADLSAELQATVADWVESAMAEAMERGGRR